MNDYSKTLVKMKKAGKLVRLAQRKNGPKSYKRGQGALMRVLLESDAPAAIRATVDRVLTDPAPRAAAARIAESFRRCGGPDAAADAILRACGGDH